MVKALAIWTTVFLSAAKVAYKVILRRPSKGGGGIHKVLILLPLLPLFLYLPWLPSSSHVRLTMAMVLSATAPAKILHLCLDKPLDPFPRSFSDFLVFTFLPIHVSSRSSAKARTVCSYGYAAKLLLLVGILNFYTIFSDIPSPVLDLLYCFHTYLGLELGMEGLATLVERVLSVQLYAPFNAPLKSASLSDFWGRRWNLTANCVLKETIYKPLLKCRVSKAIATLATFATSGVAHELIFFYGNKSDATGGVTFFFLLHGLAVVAEVAFCKRWPVLRGLPTWISRALTLTVIYATASLLFMPPLRRSKADLRIISEYHYVQSRLLNFLSLLTPAIFVS